MIFGKNDSRKIINLEETVSNGTKSLTFYSYFGILFIQW